MRGCLPLPARATKRDNGRMPNRFPAPNTKQLPDVELWELEEDYRLEIALGWIETIHGGFVTDYASLPRGAI